MANYYVSGTASVVGLPAPDRLVSAFDRVTNTLLAQPADSKVFCKLGVIL